MGRQLDEETSAPASDCYVLCSPVFSPSPTEYELSEGKCSGHPLSCYLDALLKLSLLAL